MIITDTRIFTNEDPNRMRNSLGEYLQNEQNAFEITSMHISYTVFMAGNQLTYSALAVLNKEMPD